MIVVCASPRSAIISARSRKLSLYRRYQRTQRTMISRSKWRPLKSSSTLNMQVSFTKSYAAAKYARLLIFAPQPSAKPELRVAAASRPFRDPRPGCGHDACTGLNLELRGNRVPRQNAPHPRATDTGPNERLWQGVGLGRPSRVLTCARPSLFGATDQR